MTYKLGSLFDGSGGFPLAGAMFGIHPTWASEIEPYPIAVTRERIPTMKHLGDISKINGAEIEPVDIITFGSPCQDLSVAGKRAGLKHESNGDEETTRSGLFMESVRIIKEMREATNGVCPRFAVWENVPGAFSSQRGEGLRVVLEELIKIAEPAAVMPPVPEKGWAYADSYSGDGWSIAYRVFDAQYWGVPQRRRRIHLVLDLGGQCAGEISFKCEGLRGYFETGRAPWQGIAPYAQGSIGATDREGEGNCVGLDIYNSAVTGEVAKTLDTTDPNPCKKEPQVIALDRASFNQGQNAKYDFEISDSGINSTLVATGPSAVAYWDGGQICGTLTANNAGGNQRMPDKENFNCVVIKEPQYIVRRLTPTECARLQGFPDWWGHISEKTDMTDEEHLFWLEVRNTHARINDKAEKDYTKKQMLTWYNKLHTDGAEYKMWGNGIALPPAMYVMQGIADALNAEKAKEETTEEPAEEIKEELTEAESHLHDRNDSIDSRNYAFAALQELNTDTPEEEQRDPALPEDDNIMEEKEQKHMQIEEKTTAEQTVVIDQTAEMESPYFDALTPLYHLKEEREKLANLTKDNRFAVEARALEYAVTVLEAVGL